jgi:hypothetical protein
MRKHLLAAAFLVAALAAFGCSEAPAPTSSSPPPAAEAATDSTK